MDGEGASVVENLETELRHLSPLSTAVILHKGKASYVVHVTLEPPLAEDVFKKIVAMTCPSGTEFKLGHVVNQ